MASLFDGTDEIVKQAFLDHGLSPKGEKFSSKTNYLKFSELAREKHDDAVRLIHEVMRRAYRFLRARIDDNHFRAASRIGDRARLRQEHELSPELIAATFVEQTQRELAMERAIVFTKMTKPCAHYEWFNQVNVASGLLKGKNDDKKTAIDLLRRNRQDHSLVDIVELKEWESDDNPLHAAYELFRYFLAFLILGKEGRDPNYLSGRWPVFSHMRLFVLAPDKWFGKHNREPDPALGDPDLTLDVFSSAFSFTAKEIEGFRCAEFHNRGLRLEGLTNDQFISLFEMKEKGQQRFSMSNLRDQEIDRLNGWINHAFRIVV
jgi:hypothetical protein